MFLFQWSVLVILCCGCLGGHPKSSEYKVKKIDVSDPSCKYVISELVAIDKKLFSISSFFPWLQEIAVKFKNPAGSNRRKRDMALIVNLFNSETVNAILDSLSRIFKVASPCLDFLRHYLKFWVHDVSRTITKDQWTRFFELE